MYAKYMCHGTCEEVRKLCGVSSVLPIHRIKLRSPQAQQAMLLAQICLCYNSLSHSVSYRIFPL